jgi:hypothetical protein
MAWLDGNRDSLTKAGVTVVEWPCEDNTPGASDYERKFRQLWGKDDLIVVEHDVVPTMEGLVRLAECPHDLCARVYRFYLASHDEPDKLLGFNMCRVLMPGGSQGYVADGETEADFVGFGMTRISMRFQVAHPVLDFPWGGWGNLDSRFCEWTCGMGLKWHVHWPCAKHNHYPDGYVAMEAG